MAYSIYMVFVETAIFTKWLAQNLSDDSYRELQTLLIKNPESGKIIKGCSGLRKIRWKLENRGKSGSVRIIYFYKVIAGQIYMLFAYSKKEQGDLTNAQRKALVNIAREL